MVDQLTKNLEPLLMTYGIWVAVFLAFMVLVPIGVVVWLQRRHQHHENEQLSDYYQTLATYQQQLTGIETVLNQYQQQAARFSEATRAQSADLIEQQEDCLARVMRLKSELRETESRLPQLGDQLLSRFETAEEQFEGIKSYFEQIETWYKQLYQGVADSRTQLHQLQAELQAQPADTPAGNQRLQQLWEKLRALQAETSPADPVEYLHAVHALQQDIQAYASTGAAGSLVEQTAAVIEPAPPVEAPVAEAAAAEPLASEPLASEPLASEPAPTAESSEAPVVPTSEAGVQLKAEDFAALDSLLSEPEAPISATPETSAHDQKSAASASLAASLDSELDNLFAEAETAAPVAQAEPAEAAPAEASDESEPLAETDSAEAPASEAQAKVSEEVDDAEAASGSFKLSQLTPEQVQALRQGMMPTAAESSAPGAEAAEAETEAAAKLFDQAEFDDFLAEDAVTETFLGQRGDVEQAAEAAADAAHERHDSPDEDEPAEAIDADVVTETFLGQRGIEFLTEHLEPAPAASESEADDQAMADSAASAESEPAAAALPALTESSAFLAARTRLEGLEDSLSEVESQYRELEDLFAPEAWSDALTLLDRSRYQASEAEEMLTLARRLRDLPQAPSHRVQLNLKRLQQKCQQVEAARQRLNQTRKELDSEAEELKSRLIAATEQLQDLREQVDTSWLQVQAGRLKDVRQAMERRPFHLPACRQQMRQVEIEIDLKAQP